VDHLRARHVAGTYLLSSGALSSAALLASRAGVFIDSVFDPIVSWITSWAPGLLIFVVGVLVILLAFNLIDRACLSLG